jgi:hypothetical protein
VREWVDGWTESPFGKEDTNFFVPRGLESRSHVLVRGSIRLKQLKKTKTWISSDATQSIFVTDRAR